MDVFQQRQQLASIKARVPVSQGSLATARNQLAVLLGKPPGHVKAFNLGIQLPKLPELPNMGQPTNLIEMRPDLRAALKRLKAADHEVAAAIADRLPRLSISLLYEFSASKISDPFMEELGSIAGNLIAPLVDGKRRRNEVRRRKLRFKSCSMNLGRNFSKPCSK